MDDLVGQQMGHYRLLRLLGTGSFASVYLGEHQYLLRQAALKVLHVRMDPASLETFLQEARTIARLNHPHIVHVQDFGIHEQIPYLVLDYLPNGTLRTHHPTSQRLPLERIMSYVQQLASALDYAHQQRVIHRDVKPANVLLTASGETVLSDFGLAVVQNTLASLSEQKFAGTPQYAAPEQIQGHPSPASDQYALAIMIYSWLCGEPPFSGSGLGILLQHLHESPPGLCARLPELPPAVESIVLRALAKDPAQRFASVGAFVQALHEASGLTQPLDIPVIPKDPPASLVTDPSLAATSDQHDPGRTLTEVPTRSQPRTIFTFLAPPHHHHSNLQQTRQRLLRHLKHTYEILHDTSLQAITRVELRLAEKADAVTNAVNILLQKDPQNEHMLPPGTSVVQVYEDAQQELLIIGNPGSGKSTLLIELARYLIAQAEHSPAEPLPVIVPLSSWAARRTDLEDWLGEQISQIYNLPRKLSNQWIWEQRFLPLLDGLDEMEENARPVCVAAINAYHRDYPGPLVVCSRISEYTAASTHQRLTLQSAIVVQPLSQIQINATVTLAGSSLTGLQQALHENSTLQELATLPLMLNLLMLTYQNIAVQQIPTRTRELQQQVMRDYVTRMAQRKRIPEQYPPERIYAWLGWLARHMRERNQSVFYLEHLQPDWLPAEQQRTYRATAVHLPAILLGILGTIIIQTFLPFNPPGLFWSNLLSYGLFGGLLGWLWSAYKPEEPLPEVYPHRPRPGNRNVQPLLISLSLGLLFSVDTALAYPVYPSTSLWTWIIFWLCSGGIFALGSLFLQWSFTRWAAPPAQFPHRHATQLRHWNTSPRTSLFLRSMLIAGIYGLILGLRSASSQLPFIGTPYQPLLQLSSIVLDALSSALILGLLLYGISNLFVSLTLRTLAGRVQITDYLRWSWRSFLERLLLPRHLLAVLSIIIIATLPFLFLVLFIVLSPKTGTPLNLSLLITAPAFDPFLYISLISGVIYWLLFAIVQGLQQGQIEDQDRRKINQGIRNSLKGSLLLGVLSSIVLGILSFQIYAPLAGFLETSAWLSASLASPLSGACFVVLLTGGTSVWRHYTIRRLLARNGDFPWRALDFLDDATARILLRRVGGGYSFIHRQLLDFFADQPDEDSSLSDNPST